MLAKRDWIAPVLALSTLTTLFAVSHSIEDFLYHVPEERFDIAPLPAALLVGLLLAAQVAASGLSARALPAGHLLNLVLGLLWFAAATLDHIGEVLFAHPYRNGLISKALEVGLIVASAAWALAALRAFLRSRDRDA